MPAVTKKIVECYEVRHPQGEWANITLHCWDRPTLSGRYYCGEIVAHGSFGTFGHTWTACGVPFKEFLLDVGFDYFMTKCLGLEAEVFDGERSVASFLQHIVKTRRNRDVDAETARIAYDEVVAVRSQACSSIDAFVYELSDAGRSAAARSDGDERVMEEIFAEPWGFALKRPAPGTEQFWKLLWPQLCEQLALEVALGRKAA